MRAQTYERVEEFARALCEAIDKKQEFEAWLSNAIYVKYAPDINVLTVKIPGCFVTATISPPCVSINFDEPEEFLFVSDDHTTFSITKPDTDDDWIVQTDSVGITFEAKLGDIPLAR